MKLNLLKLIKLIRNSLKIKKEALASFFCFCTEGRTRTGTLLPRLDFESSASTNSTTPAIQNYLDVQFTKTVFIKQLNIE